MKLLLKKLFHNPLFVSIIFALLTFLALRSVLFTSGTIGHTWDWGVPNFPEQFKIQTLAQFFLWDARLFGGNTIIFRTEIPYWSLLLLFSALGGELISKLIPLVFILVSALTMFYLARKDFSFSFFWAIIAGIFYAFSPYVYTRLIAGHLTTILGYSLLPLFLSILFRLSEKIEERKGDYRRPLLLIIILFPFINIHLNLSVISLLIFFFFFFFFFYQSQNRKKRLIVFLITALGFILINAFWILPVGYSSLAEGTIPFRIQKTMEEEAIQRVSYFETVSQPLANLLTFKMPFGLNTEFVFPLDGWIKPLHALISVIFFVVAFMGPFWLKKDNKSYSKIWFLFLLFLFGLGITTGARNTVGVILYKILLNFFPSLFAGFSNPLRFLPLVILPLSILAFVILLRIEKKFRQDIKISFRILVVILLSIFLYPWFFHNLTTSVFEGSSQPMSLKITEINLEDKKVFDFLKRFKEDFRVAYLPPTFVSWPGETDLSYNWNIIYSPKSVFLEHIEPSLAKIIIGNLYSQKASKDLGKLLGLGAVKNIVYPHYQRFESYLGYIQGTINYKPFVDRNWSEQKDVRQLPVSFSTVDLYENEDFIPHIFIPEQISYLDGVGGGALLDIISLADYQTRNGVFFSYDNKEEKIPLIDKTEVIFTKPECVGCEPIHIDFEELHPTPRFLPSSPFYFLATIKEGQPSGSASQKAYRYLVLSTKKLAETELIIEKKEDNLFSASTSISKFYTMLLDYERQLDQIFEEGLINNQLLVKSIIFLNRQQETLIEIARKTRNNEILETTKQSLENLNRILTKVNSEVWLIDNPHEIKYLFNVPDDGQYLLLRENFQDESIQLLNFEVDDVPFTEGGSKIDDNWSKLKTIDLKEGFHKLKVSLPPSGNLFSGFATSSAAKRNPEENSFTLIAQERTTTISSLIDNLDDNRQYRLSFRYMVLGHPIRFTLEQENDEVVRGAKKHKIEILLLDSPGWQVFNQVFSPNFGSHQAEMKIYLNADQDRADIYHIADIKIEPVLIPNLLLRKETSEKTIQIPKITFTKINPTKYKVRIEGAKKPYFLVFSEAFNSNWKAYINRQQLVKSEPKNEAILASYYGGQIQEGEHKNTFWDRSIFTNLFKEPISEKNHLLVNAFANAWFIDEIGNYEIIIEFVPQRIYFLGLFISSLCFVFVSIYLGILSVKQWKKRK